MTESGAVPISSTVSVPLAELRFQASRAGGPGGQHVNRSATRVELWWDLLGSPSLSPEERARARRHLAGRLTADGWLRIVAAATRSQARNRDAALERFREVLARALVIPKRRKPTRPPRAAKERRLRQKKERGVRKRERRRPADLE